MDRDEKEKMMRVSIAVMLLILVFSGFVNADDDVVAELKRLEQELAQAIEKRDAETVQRIEAETYVHTDSNAKVDTREDFLRSYRSGSSEIQSIRFDHLVVDVYGNAAVVRGITTVEFSKEGSIVTRVARYTRFYVRFKEGWRAVAGHSSALPS